MLNIEKEYNILQQTVFPFLLGYNTKTAIFGAKLKMFLFKHAIAYTLCIALYALLSVVWHWDFSAIIYFCNVSKDAKIRNRYNQVPHLTHNTNGKVTNLQLDTTYESQEVSSIPAGDHKAQINKRSQRHNKHKTEKT